LGALPPDVVERVKAVVQRASLYPTQVIHNLVIAFLRLGSEMN
jgi:hypothetical protein